MQRCVAVAQRADERRALRGVRAQPLGRLALLQRLLVSRAHCACAAAHRPRLRLPAVLRAPGAGLRALPARHRRTAAAGRRRRLGPRRERPQEDVRHRLGAGVR